MAEATTSPIQTFIDTATQGTNQMLGIYRQAAKFSIEATGTWLDTVGKVTPVARLSTGIVKPWLSAGLAVFDRAVEVQRELATDAIDRLATIR